MKYTAKQYAKTLYELTDSKKGKELEEMIKKFLLYLFRKNDFKKIESIINEFVKYSDEQSGVVRSEVISAIKLSSKDKKKMANLLESMTGKKVILTEKEDKGLIGGVKILTGDKMIDGSLKNKINNFKKQFV